MIISVQIYNFYLRKDKIGEENVSFVGNKQQDNIFPHSNERPKYLQTAIRKISTNKNKQIYFSLCFSVLIFFASSQQF